METTEMCRERAAEDRANADRAETPRQRDLYLRSALRWEGMLAMKLEKRDKENALREKISEEKRRR